MASDRERRRRGCLVLAFLGGTCLLVLLAGYLIVAVRLQQDAPLARMYRTEADLAGLVKAVDAYFRDHGQYPPAGPEGLRLATDHLSRKANYFPHGPTPDAWGRPYHYVPHTAYDADPAALRDQRGYGAPDSYQLYSMGADGDAGVDDPEKQGDNICSWEEGRSWRAAYRARNKDFMRRGKDNR